MPLDRDRRVENALISLQLAITPEHVWRSSVKLMRAAMPVYNVLIGLPSLGITPMFMRATKPIPNVERFAQLAPLNAVIRDRPLAPVARMSDHFVPDSPDGRAFTKEFLEPMGWRYGAAMLFWNPNSQFIGQLAVIRTHQQGDFTNSEMDRLHELHPHMDAVIHRLFALENAFAAHLSLEHAIGALPLPIVIVGWNGKLNYSNAAARDAMSAWNSTSHSNGRLLKASKVLPSPLRSACQSLKLSFENDLISNNGHSTRRITLEHSSIKGLRAEIQLVESQAGRALQPSFAIHFQLPTSLNGQSADALRRLSDLTSSEFEVARRAAGGDDNSDISRALGISLSTVRTHLRHIFAKLSISSRAKLAPLYQNLGSK